MNITKFMSRLKSMQEVIHIEEIPERKPEFGKLEFPLPSILNDVTTQLGIKDLYKHQVKGINLIRKGKNIVFSTSTSSGKTLGFTLPVIENILEKPANTALYIYPTNALVNDQGKFLYKISNIINKNNNDIRISVKTYTGQTPTSEKKIIRDNIPNILLTNPEMLHFAITKFHFLWKKLFRNLQYIVVDEVHQYTGIFGSHFSHILARLRNISKFYNANPQFLFSSATIANPVEHCSLLAGEEVKPIKKDTAGHKRKYFVFWNSVEFQKEKVKKFSNRTLKDTVNVLFKMIIQNIQTILFVKSRKKTEEIRDLLIQKFEDSGKLNYEDKIAAYHGHLSPRKRKLIENKLKTNQLICVITTNALELGIDIGSLDACVISGYPGSIIDTWQEAGRAGRSSSESVIILMADSNPLDQYIINNSAMLFGEKGEYAIINRKNKFILSHHIKSFAVEIETVVNEKDLKEYFGDIAVNIVEESSDFKRLESWQVCDKCNRKMEVREGRRGKFIGCTGFKYNKCNNTKPISEKKNKNKKYLYCKKCKIYFSYDCNHKYCPKCGRKLVLAKKSIRNWETNLERSDLEKINIRSIDSYDYTLIDAKNNKLPVSIDSESVYRDAHRGAIYSISGKKYRVKFIDEKKREINVIETTENIKTQAKVNNKIFLNQEGKKQVASNFEIGYGEIVFEELVKGYFEIDLKDLEPIKGRGEDFDNPYKTRFETNGLWIKVSRNIEKQLQNSRIESSVSFIGGLHGIQHVLQTVIASVVLCDVDDLDGLSISEFQKFHNDSAIFVFDRYKGGLGLSEKAFDQIHGIIDRAYQVISNCNCHADEGCIKCIQIPRCRERNRGLNKNSALFILKKLRTNKFSNRKLSNSKKKLQQKVYNKNSKKYCYDSRETKIDKSNQTYAMADFDNEKFFKKIDLPKLLYYINENKSHNIKIWSENKWVKWENIRRIAKKYLNKFNECPNCSERWNEAYMICPICGFGFD